jgi:[ribosomal protein S5]-alanine N-acetyltransferase
MEPLEFLPLPALRGERVILRRPQESDVDDRLRHPIDPEEEDGYGSSWRLEWDGRRYHTREKVAAFLKPSRPLTSGVYFWAIEHEGHCIGTATLSVLAYEHRGRYSVGLFAGDLRGRGLGREVTRLVLAWSFGVLGAHRVELEVLAGNSRAVSCYLACGFRSEGVRRDAELYPGGWRDFILMGILQPEWPA